MTRNPYVCPTCNEPIKSIDTTTAGSEAKVILGCGHTVDNGTIIGLA